jgi:hypothetical protein
MKKIFLYIVFFLGLIIICISPILSQCTDECKRGYDYCINDSNYNICGNFDSDPCSEFVVSLPCLNGEVCRIGECVNLSKPNICNDSDGGLNYYVYGSLSGICSDVRGGGCGAFFDRCVNETTLVEYSCNKTYSFHNSNEAVHTYYDCKNGCVNGACKSETEDVSGCKSLYWFDNSNKSCGLKEFCGMYMYLGLQTFESKTQCEKSLSENIVCYKEGESYPRGENKTCCDGLKEAAKIIPSATCLSTVYRLPSQLICINCSNSLCENIENNCNCPEDCNETLSGDGLKQKILPETASQRAREILGDLGFNITMKNVGKDRNPVYLVSGVKEVKLFGFIKKNAIVSVEVDIGNGEVTKINKPWWAFLASGI